MLKYLAAAALLAVFGASATSAADLSVARIGLSAPVKEIAAGDAGVLAKLEGGDVLLIDENGMPSAVSAASWPQDKGPLEPPMVRDGRLASDPESGLSAWYSGETTQYGHGALGDAIEARRLVVRDRSGAIAAYEADGDEVFEDLEPRIVDLDNDLVGKPEIVAITASENEGAGIAVFTLGRDSAGKPALLRLANSRRIGSAYRWLNIAGIADFDGDGFTEIAFVDRPHIRGELVFLEWRGGRLGEQEREGGFANHHGGSTVQDLSEVADVDGDGRPDLILPTRGYRSLVALSLDRKGLRQLAEVKIESAPRSAILRAGPISAVFVDGEGALFRISWTP